MTSTFKMLLVASVLPVLASVSFAQNIDYKSAEGFVSGGISSASGTDNGFAFKAGVELPGLTKLGAVDVGGTAYYARNSFKEAYSNYLYKYEVKYTQNVFAVGPTFGFKLPDQPITLTGRVVLALEKDSASYSGSGLGYVDFASGSDTGIELGLGLGVRYDLNKQMSLRADFDNINEVSAFTAGVNFKF